MTRLDVLLEPDSLLGDRSLRRDGLLFVEHDFVLLSSVGGAFERVADVGVGDRLALDADLLRWIGMVWVISSSTTDLRRRTRPAARVSIDGSEEETEGR